MKYVESGGIQISEELAVEFRNQLPHISYSNVYGIKIYLQLIIFKIIIKYYYIKNHIKGMTEIGNCISKQNKNCKIPNSIGFLNKNLQVKAVNLTTGKNLGPNQVGEFWIKSSSIMISYFRDPEATKRAIDDECMEILFLYNYFLKTSFF